VSGYPFPRDIGGRGDDEGCDGGCNAVDGIGKQTTAKKSINGCADHRRAANK
jgi:hypothetical protein